MHAESNSAEKKLSLCSETFMRVRMGSSADFPRSRRLLPFDPGSHKGLRFVVVSFQAMAWAVRQKTPSATSKFLLVIMANYADESGIAYPSVERLSQDTQQDRKTVMGGLTMLQEAKLIKDTGTTCGPTRRVKVYQLCQKETVPKTELFSGTVPKFPLNSPVFPFEQSQKRDTDPIREPVIEPKQERVIEPAASSLKKQISEMFDRPSANRWTYAEERLLVDISKRPKVQEEFEDLRAFRNMMEDTKYFPQSIHSLLANWEKTLDRKRTKDNGKHEKSLAMKRLDAVAAETDRVCAETDKVLERIAKEDRENRCNL